MALWLAVVVVLFAENGDLPGDRGEPGRAEAVALADPGQVGQALGGLRFWKPIGIITILLIGGWLAERSGVGAILVPLAVIQALAFAAAMLIQEPKTNSAADPDRMPGGPDTSGPEQAEPAAGPVRSPWRDAALWSFIAAMVLFHAANAPGGVYLGLFLSGDLHAAPRRLAEAFVVSMAAWMIVVRPAGTLADRWGRRPLLIAAWAIMAVRLAVVAVARTGRGRGEPGARRAVQRPVRGARGRLGDRPAGRRPPAGEAQAIVGTSWSSARRWGLISRPSGSRRWAIAGSSACWRASGRPRRCWCLRRPRIPRPRRGRAIRTGRRTARRLDDPAFARGESAAPRPVNRRGATIDRRQADSTDHQGYPPTDDRSTLTPTASSDPVAAMTSIIFGLTYLFLAIGKVPRLRIDRAGIALVGAAANPGAAGARPGRGGAGGGRADDRAAVRHDDRGGLVRLSGFFAVVTSWIATRRLRPNGLLATTIGLAGVLSAFLVNDVVCVAMTPLVLDLCRRRNLPPIPYLIGLATASNIGSVATITGNPQNIIIGNLSGIAYVRFAARLAPVAASGC